MQQIDTGIELMTEFEAEAHSFVVRLWTEGQGATEAEAEWRGWIEHVQNGQRRYFRDTAEIGHIVASHLTDVSGV